VHAPERALNFGLLGGWSWRIRPLEVIKTDVERDLHGVVPKVCIEFNGAFTGRMLIRVIYIAITGEAYFIYWYNSYHVDNVCLLLIRSRRK
jgi:hypothetical protein